MLETKGLVKIYKPKKGVPVRALDGVSLKFPDKGMIFLLGKSGSGKSTLLNLLGGLDKYDGGEIIIKNVSSKDFDQQHFDSYRNTYVGFIFQEYNILDEFSVGANIALALELQGKKATDEEINRILTEVDMEGYGNRNPNELSGGQKQRVAIARALVKNPKIIMADEPSGALDSVTGKQIFETLKKLSKEKLVIVVSHDREFAEGYADRIIELGDGKVISDTTCDVSQTEVQTEEGLTFEGNKATISKGYRLTEEDRILINEYLETLERDGEIEFSQGNIRTREFVPTNQEDIKSDDNSPFELIKSKLSFKHAFKIGGSGLKHKKFRLIMTIFLSCIAFTMFGFVDTMSAYNHIQACTDSIYDSNIRYATISKEELHKDDGFEYWTSYMNPLSDEEIQRISQKTGIEFNGALNENGAGYYLDNNIPQSDYVYFGSYNLYPGYLSGVTEVDEELFGNLGYNIIAGRMPDGNKDEILISEYAARIFMKKGYCSANAIKEDEEIEKKTTKDVYISEDVDVYYESTSIIEKGKSEKISKPQDMVGKTLLLGNYQYTIVGIVDTKFDISRYEHLDKDNRDEIETNHTDYADQIKDFVMITEFRSAFENDYTGMIMSGEGFLNRFRERMVNPYKYEYGYDKSGYDLALGAMPKDKGDIKNLVEYCYDESDGIRYPLSNPPCFELDGLDEVFETLASVLLYVGLGFALFAAILLSNFIATSIAYKKQEIGILRAIGSRGNDVFRIFFAEAFIIAVINFLLSSVFTGLLVNSLNNSMRMDAGLLITILNFGPRQLFLIFGVSVLVAALASFIPVKKIASKRPIDAIRNR